MSEMENWRLEIEYYLNYRMQERFRSGEFPSPVIIGATRIYNTYNSEEVEHWKKYGYAKRKVWLLR